jgi:hypothetical protein
MHNTYYAHTVWVRLLRFVKFFYLGTLNTVYCTVHKTLIRMYMYKHYYHIMYVCTVYTVCMHGCEYVRTTHKYIHVQYHKYV